MRLRLDWAEQSAGVAELVDALVLGTSGVSRGGSSPLPGTNYFVINITYFVRTIAKYLLLCYNYTNQLQESHHMRYLISILLPALLISITACASNPNQPDQASAQAEKTEMRCETRSHSGSRLGVRKCRRVKVSEEEEG